MLRRSMRGADDQQNHIFSYLSPEERVRNDHPLRAIRAMVDEALTQLSGQLDAMYASVGRPSIAPEQLLRAQLLQMLYSVRSERLLMEEMDYNLLFRWFVGLNADGRLEGVMPRAFISRRRAARQRGLRMPNPLTPYINNHGVKRCAAPDPG